MTRLFAKLLAALALLAAFPATAQPVDTGHLMAELVARDRSVAPGATTYVALRQEIDKGWHTYWRNSGDSGEATSIQWTLPEGWTAGDIVWATPHRQPTGPLMNYGYQGEVLLPVPITVPADARPGETVTLKAAATFLVCEEICVPEQAELTISLPVKDGLAEPDPKWGAAIAKALATAPAPAGLSGAFQKTAEGALALAITRRRAEGAPISPTPIFSPSIPPPSITPSPRRSNAVRRA
jgi:DsbC/DsbD-like thiol-disulfide interchange protein